MADLTSEQKARVVELKAKGASYRLICAAVNCRLSQAKQVMAEQASQAERERLARDKAEARRLYLAGERQSDIARNLHRARATIRRWTRDLKSQHRDVMRALADMEGMTWL